jgi:hypothetical protein
VQSLWTRPRDELLRFFVNRNISPYLKTAIQRDDFVARFQVSRTTIRFERLDLDERVLNGKLGDDQPLRVRSASLAGVVLHVPWSDLAADHVLVQIERLALVVSPFDAARDAPVDSPPLDGEALHESGVAASAMQQSSLFAASRDNAFAGDPWMAAGNSAAPSAAEASELGAAFAADDDGSQAAKTALEHLFANMFANLHFQLDALDVRVDYADNASLDVALRGALLRTREASAADVVRKVMSFESLAATLSPGAVELFSVRSAGAVDEIGVDFAQKALEEVSGVEEQPRSLAIVAKFESSVRLALTTQTVDALSRCASAFSRAASDCRRVFGSLTADDESSEPDAGSAMSQSILLRLSPYSKWRPRTATLMSEATLLEVRLQHVTSVLGGETLHLRGITAKHVFVERATEFGCALVQLTDGADALFQCGAAPAAPSRDDDDDDGAPPPPLWLRSHAATLTAATIEHNVVVVLPPIHVHVAVQRVRALLELFAPLATLQATAPAAPAASVDVTKRIVRLSLPSPLQLQCRLADAHVDASLALHNAAFAVVIAPLSGSVRSSLTFDVAEFLLLPVVVRKTKTKRSAASRRAAAEAPLLRVAVRGQQASVIELRTRTRAASASDAVALPAHRDDALWSMAQVMVVQQEPAAARLGFEARQHVGAAHALKTADVCVQALLRDVDCAVESVVDAVRALEAVSALLPPPAAAPPAVDAAAAAPAQSFAVQTRVDRVDASCAGEFALHAGGVDVCAASRFARLPVWFLFAGAAQLALTRSGASAGLLLCGTPTGLLEQLPAIVPDLVVSVEGASVRAVLGAVQTTLTVTRLSLVPHVRNWLALVDAVAVPPPVSDGEPPRKSSAALEFGIAVRHVNVLHLFGAGRSGALCVALDNTTGRCNASSSAHVTVQSVSVTLLSPVAGGETVRRWIPSSSGDSSHLGHVVGLLRAPDVALDVHVALGTAPTVVAADVRGNVLRFRFTKSRYEAFVDALGSLGAAAAAHFDAPMPQLQDDAAEAERVRRRVLLEETLKAAFARERQQQAGLGDGGAPIDMGGSILVNANEVEVELADMRGSMLLVERESDGAAPSEERVQSEVDAVMRSTEWVVMQDELVAARRDADADQAGEFAKMSRVWSLPVDDAFAHTPLALSLQIARCGVSFVLAGEPQTGASAPGGGANAFDALELRLNAPLIRFEQFQLATSRRGDDGVLPSAPLHPAHFYDQFTPNVRVSVRLDLLDVRDHVLTSSYKRAFRLQGDGGDAVPELRFEYLAHQRWSPLQRKLSMLLQVPPLRAYVNQDSWVFLWQFLTRSDAPPASATPASAPDALLPTLVELFDVSPIGIELDYKPGIRAGAFTELMANGDFVYLMKAIPLEQAHIDLRRLRLRNVLAENVSTLAFQRFFPNYGRSHLAKLLVGVQPVHVVFKLGQGAADLLRVPLAEYRRGGSVVGGLQTGLKTLTVEVLTLGSRVSSVTARLLGGGSDTATGGGGGAGGGAGGDEAQRISRYANQPSTVNEGVQQAVEHLRDGVLSGLRAVAVDPINAYQRDGAWAFLSSAVSGVPRLVLRPAMGVSNAIAKVTQGVRNSLEPERKREADQKWKATGDNERLDDFDI